MIAVYAGSFRLRRLTRSSWGGEDYQNVLCMRNGAVSSKSLVPRRSRMKEFCGDDVEVCQPSVGGLLAACVLFANGSQNIEEIISSEGPVTIQVITESDRCVDRAQRVFNRRCFSLFSVHLVVHCRRTRGNQFTGKNYQLRTKCNELEFPESKVVSLSNILCSEIVFTKLMVPREKYRFLL